jgi:NAD(P)H-dependent flavin oxidoreductase YrpB (nitropropane dioxygenase family)
MQTRVGCGFITWSLARKPHLLELALAHAPAAVMLSFGALAPFAQRIKAAGAMLICQVQTLALAREAVAAGADVIVAQGAEAGGHGREAALAEAATLEREEARYWKGLRTGDVDNTCVLTGQAIGLIHEVAPAGEILGRIVREAEDLLRTRCTKARLD